MALRSRQLLVPPPRLTVLVNMSLVPVISVANDHRITSCVVELDAAQLIVYFR